MMMHAMFRVGLLVMVVAGLSGCGQGDTPSDETADPQARSERLGEIQALADSAREAHDHLEGVWDAESVYTAPSGEEARLKTVLTFERDGEGVKWAEAYDPGALEAGTQAAVEGRSLLVWPKATLLAGGFEEGYVYVNMMHLVFDEHASFEAGAAARQKAYDAIREDEYDTSDELTAILYQPYVVKSVDADRIVLQRPDRVFPEAVEQNMIAEDENPEQIGGRLELTLTRRARP